VVAPFGLAGRPTNEWLSLDFHPDDQATAIATWQHAVATKETYDHVARVRSIDRDYRWIHSRAVPVMDAKNEVIEWIGTSADITNRKQAESTNARLAAIVESSQDAIISVTPEGTILDWNPGAEALYGFSPEEVVGRDFSVLIPLDLARASRERIARLLLGDPVPLWETVRLRKDGTRVDVEVQLSLLRDADGRVNGISEIARDVTERKHLEQLRQDMLDIVSHDLRTPQAVISMRAQLLQNRRAYDEPAVRVILEQAQRIARLIDDLGDVVQLEAGRLAIKPEAVSLHVLAREAVARARTQTARHHISVETSETPVIGHWDRARLEEVFDNLLDNAIKYSPRGGAIVVQVEATDEEAQLRVTDQGIGIPAELLPRLFERLQRGEGTGIAGLGLGLYISRMLVEAHGGRITVQSVLGEGTTFTVWLPLERTA
jgi:PAS domain S-box-containing protein